MVGAFYPVFTMTYYQILPPASLADYVDYFWVGEADASNDQPFVHWSIAASTPKLIFHYKGHFDEVTDCGNLVKSFSAGIQGQTQSYKRFVSSQKVGIFGVQFFPFAIPLLFSIPASDVSNRLYDMQTLFGGQGREMEGKIYLANTHAERVTIINRFLEHRIKLHNDSQQPICAAIRYVNREKGIINIQQLARNTSLSPRQFERKFTAFAGFTPKLYARIVRFETAVNYFIHYKKTLTDVALSSGYYDQPHFIHDCKAFTGVHPKRYLIQWQNRLQEITNDGFLHF